jgi:cell division protein FtsZ
LKSIIDNTIRESEKRRDRKASEERRGYDSSIDQELEDIIQRSRAKICVVGTGGGGNNTVSRLTEIGIEGAETISMNTDAQDLFYSIADKKILIGRNTCGGLGAGGMPEVGEECAEESDEDIKETLEGADMVFVTCGMGGGTGTGKTPECSRHRYSDP